jgi:hypothetical protein
VIVEADEGVEVDDAAALVFGDFAVGDPELMPWACSRGGGSG